MSFPLSDFPFLQNNPQTLYLDNASTTQKPQSVIDTVNQFLSHDYSNIHRGQYDSSYRSEQWYKKSKKATAQHLGCSPQEIIYGHHATHCSTIIAQALCISKIIKPWQSVAIAHRDHHAWRVVWQRLQKIFDFTIVTIPLTDQDTIDRAQRSQLLTQHDIAVVHAWHGSNVTGSLYDIKKLFATARTHHSDVFCIADASQSLPHIAVDVSDLGCDALYATGHKMLAYTGIGILYLKKSRLSQLEPLMWGGAMVQDVTHDGHTLTSWSARFEPWTPNLIGAVSLFAARDYLDNHGREKLSQHEHSLTKAYLELFDHYEKKWLLTLYGRHDTIHRLWVFSFRVHDLHPLDVWDIFAENNIAIRVGGHCAHPLVSQRWKSWVCRLSVYGYNTKEEIERVDKVFAAMMQ